MIKLALDIDGVLADFTTAYARCMTRRTGIKFPVDDPGFPSTWFWDRALGVSPEQEQDVWQHDIISSANFWQKLGPVQNAQPALKRVNQLAMNGTAEVFFLTHRVGKKVKLQTERWLYNLGVSYPTVIVTGDKVPFLRALKANLFIDDKPETIADVAKVCTEEKWENFHLFLKDAPYNRADTPAPARRVSDVLQALGEAYGG